MSTLGKSAGPSPAVAKIIILAPLPRISVPNARMSLDLSNHGAGPDIEIWGQWEGHNQLWIFDEGKLDVVGIHLQQHN